MAAFGLDISSHSMKAMQLEKRGDNFALLAAGVAATPVKGLDSEIESDIVKVAEAVKKLLADTKIVTKEVNISLPESKVFSRLIRLPLLTDQEIAAAISWQAEPYIPIPIADASIDYQIVRRFEAAGGKSGGVEVLLVAAPKTLIAKYAKLADILGLTIASVETELLALARSLAPAKQTVLVADMGGISTDMAIIRSGQLAVSRSVPTGGNVFTRAVSTGLSVNASRAEEYKKSYGLASDQLEGKVRASLEPVLRVIVDEMNKTIQYYKTDLGENDPVSAAIVSGGTANMNHLTSFLAEKLGIEVLIGDPFANVVKSEALAKNLLPVAPLYGVVVGLAQNI
ncbi:hypothetical protein CMO96_04065 [Candidatus Woesebacteria bacterium]|nr:hypothetical protein [Candidatus Woesebacteria bacterium]|tara:strand:+ start:739 stop:1761 length:1023 start_codon:yes stop_codon:yes gene_type:complete